MSWLSERNPVLHPWKAPGYIRLAESFAEEATPLSDTLSKFLDDFMPAQNFWQEFMAEQSAAMRPVMQFESIGQRLAASMGMDELKESLLGFQTPLSEQLRVDLDSILSPTTIASFLETLRAPTFAGSESWAFGATGSVTGGSQSVSSWLESFTATREGRNLLDSLPGLELNGDQEANFEERLAEYPELEEQLEDFGEKAVSRGVISRAVLDGLRSRRARHAYIAILVAAIGSAAYFGSLQINDGEFTSSDYLIYLLAPYGPFGFHLAYGQKWTDPDGKDNH